MDEGTKRAKRQVAVRGEMLAADGLSMADISVSVNLQNAYDEAALWVCRWERGENVDLRAMGDAGRRIFCRYLASR